LSIEGFDGFVTSTAAPIASGWSDKLPGGACTRWETKTFHGAQWKHYPAGRSCRRGMRAPSDCATLRPTPFARQAI
ncbi:MAG TPA: hypothetical protein VG826_32785, partial [Pirellulales bacterium]|nr:hypothetical protein [Pirellulales bacterium]